MKKLLIVEDDIAFARILEAFLKKKEYEVASTSTLKDASKYIQKQSFDLFLLDYRLPDGTGLDLLQEVRESNPGAPVIIMTGFHDVRTVVKAMKMGASDYITKPVNPDELLMVLEQQLKKSATTPLLLLQEPERILIIL